ncbi:aminotransferase [Mycena alexandri]|uniref:Branched-chain-amino-acid aminotransferase n=1 Tax=Mycena alexandri TaxID=1745969 RepID=A0AAD6SUE5_9AGAR|nr:aminotransferase [Mycena alexandri]
MTSPPQANGHAHHIAPLDASLLTIQRAETLKPVPEPGTYTFGDIKTDHMLVMTYDPVVGWSAPQIKPYGPLALDPASNCFQYCTNVFEGMKAILNPDGTPCMFRPVDNMRRLQSSGARMALPPFDADALLTCITKLVLTEARWIPAVPGHALYIRPTLIGTKPSIKVGASDHATLYTIVTPVGPYFPTTTGGVSLLAVGEHVRSWPGGTGGFKLGLNYSPGFVPQQAAAVLGYDQVLWLIGEDKQITEAGAMNFFAVVERDDGGLNIVTPPLDGTILPGITRDSTLVLLHAHAADTSRKILDLPVDKPVYIEERILSVNELAEWAKAGNLLECFGTGTAVLVVAVERIGDLVGADVKQVRDIEMKAGRGLGPVGQALWDKLLALKEGRDEFAGWSVKCE